MIKVLVEKVTNPAGITKDYFNPRRKETYPVEVKNGKYIVNYNGHGEFKWTQISFDTLKLTYKPIGGQQMGENGEYEAL